MNAPLYNFIFSVGGGSAGSVLAARLSEDPETRVLLLEAGGSPPFLASIPVLGAFLQKTYYDWQYKTVPQKNACKAMKDQVLDDKQANRNFYWYFLRIIQG